MTNDQSRVGFHLSLVIRHLYSQVASARLFALDGFKERFEISFSEAPASLALDDFKE
jgi:hypothetical protein